MLYVVVYIWYIMRYAEFVVFSVPHLRGGMVALCPPCNQLNARAAIPVMHNAQRTAYGGTNSAGLWNVFFFLPCAVFYYYFVE